VGACTSSTDGAVIDRKTSALASTDPAVLRAHGDAEDKQARRDLVTSLKARLALTPASDWATQASMGAQIASEEAILAAAMPGVVGVPPGAIARPSADPQSVARARLLAKLSAYDMTKPEDVAAWAALKHKELGQ
jgi:hypothetical protein